MKKVKNLLSILAAFLMLSSCGVNNSKISDTQSESLSESQSTEHSDTQSESLSESQSTEHSETQSESLSESQSIEPSDTQSESHGESKSTEHSENSSEASGSELKKINASVILDYGKLKANKVTTILDKEIDFDVSKEIATLVYGDEVVISYREDEVDYSVEVIEKELLEDITVTMMVAPGAPEGGYECFTNTDGVVLNIENIEYIINLDGSYVSRYGWARFTGTPLYASYNPNDSKQTTEFSTLHYLTALYSYNPRKVDNTIEEEGVSNCCQNII